MDVSFNGKDAKNSSDYRKSLLIVAKWFSDNLPEHFFNKILLSMCNIQAITYYSEKKRSLQSILRLYSTTFQHALTIKTSLLGNIKGSTARKFFGSYYHSIVKHSPFQYRLFSGRTSNTEKEESTFNSMKMFTNLASNHHSENIIVNVLVRIQAKEKLDEGKAESNYKDTIFNKLYEPIEKLQANTIISFQIIKSYPKDYQSFLENIADFLLDANIWWKEVEDGVMFQDLHPVITHSTLSMHHFRSTNLKNEEIYLKNCWKKCLEKKNSLIPAYKIFDKTNFRNLIF